MNKRLFFLAAMCFVQLTLHGQTTNHQVYAVFVMSIAKYSSWPESDAKDFRITVLGKSKVFDELSKVAPTKQIQGKKIHLVQTDEVSKIDACEIVYVSDSRSGQLGELIRHLAGKPVMIITEREGLFKKGADFSFVVIDNNGLRFDINKKALESRQIKISQNLTTLANEVI